MKSIYESGVYLERNPTWHEEDAPWKVAQIKKMLSRNHLEPARICDIGCGTGEVLRQLADQCVTSALFVGYDISPQAHEIAKSKERHNLEFKLAGLPTEAEPPYDLLMCIDVFEHIEDYFSLLRNARARATYKLFHIPLDLSVQTVLRGKPLMQRRSSIGHIHYFTKDTALATLTDTGHEIVDCFFTHKFCDSNQSGISDNVLKLALKSLFSIHEDLAARIVGCSSLMVLTR